MTSPPQFAREVACACTGNDETANAVFLHALLHHDDEYRAVCAHWEALSEEHQSALAAHLGLAEPSKERPPVNAGILATYRKVMEWMAEAIGEPQG